MKKSTAFRKLYIQDSSWDKLRRLADHFAAQGIAVRDNRGLPSLSATVRLLIDIVYEREFNPQPIASRRTIAVAPLPEPIYAPIDEP